MRWLLSAAVALLLAAAPAHAQSPSGQLCAMTGECSSVDFGHYHGHEQGSADTDKRCLPCEEAAQRELDKNLAEMHHPTPLLLAGNPVDMLNEDAAAASEAMEVIELTLEATLTVEALPEILAVGVGLLALNAVMDVRSADLSPNARVPAWLNLLSFSQASTNTDSAAGDCAALEAAAQAACANLPIEACSESDDCRTLLDKRKPRLTCDHAWQALRDSPGHCQTKGSDYELRTRNAREVSDCGLMISKNKKCCSPDIGKQKDICKEVRECNGENKLDDDALLKLDSKALDAHCLAAREKWRNADACRSARMAERDQCYEGLLDAGHAKELNAVILHVVTCAAFLENLRRFASCP